MLIRLLGKEDEALNSKGDAADHPFRDVPSWANRYVGYAYKQKLAQGISRNSFGSTDPVTASQYFTFILRALGYSDAAGDFRWDQSIHKAAEIGIKAADAFDAGDPQLVRGQLANISYHALQTPLQGSDKTLLQKLDEAGAIKPERSTNETPAKPSKQTQVVVPAEPYESSGAQGQFIITGETIKKHFPQADYFVNGPYPTLPSLSREQLDTIGLGYTLYPVANSSIDLRNNISKKPFVLAPTEKNAGQIKVIFDAKGNFLAYATWEDGRPERKQWVLHTSLPSLLLDMHAKAVEMSKGAYAFSSSWLYKSNYAYDNYSYFDEAGERITRSGLRFEAPEGGFPTDAQPEERTVVPTIKLDANRLPEAARNFTKLSWVYTKGMTSVADYGDLQRVLVWNRLAYLLTGLEFGNASGYHAEYRPTEAFPMLATPPDKGSGVAIMMLVDDQDKIVAYTHYTNDQRRKWSGG